MNFLTLIAFAKKAKVYYDFAWAMTCLVGAPVLVVGVPIYWLSEGSHGFSTTVRPSSSYHVQKGESATVDSTTQVQGKVMKMIYRLELVDQEGRPAYKYPEVRLENSKIPEFSNMMIQVPEDAVPGAYNLIARVKYAINPLKTDDLTVQVASITVEDPK